MKSIIPGLMHSGESEASPTSNMRSSHEKSVNFFEQKINIFGIKTIFSSKKSSTCLCKQRTGENFGVSTMSIAEPYRLVFG